jgi:hypothetical protein
MGDRELRPGQDPEGDRLRLGSRDSYSPTMAHSESNGTNITNVLRLDKDNSFYILEIYFFFLESSWRKNIY